MKIVRCNHCGWIGREQDLNSLHVLFMDTGFSIDYENCPECHGIGALMDVEHGCHFDDAQILQLWWLFDDIPINIADEIMDDFLGFEAGTSRFEIWKWFDQHYSKGVYSLVYNGGE